ncbi:MAG TPA: acetoin utilization protein AcuC [Verrucomicrobiota bacterium]|nr:acetoin utilization protein AcuC [Verrucomicrobiota bacterium]HNU51448.1 acetoin utilization protein AcuC [Verrucomicrobiota bacterium]
MNDPRLAFMYVAEIEGLRYPEDCPFKTQRTGMVRKQLQSFGLIGGPGRDEIGFNSATIEELSGFHTEPYLEELQRAAGGNLTIQGLHMGLGGLDTPVFPDLFRYGALACGAALRAADLLIAGDADVVFSLPGGFHHAKAAHAGGFCYLNDVVLACSRLAAAGRRVAYLDIDAHHGDGVQEAFYGRSDVLTVSMHESGKTLYPWGGFETELGEGAGLGYNVNVPLPAGIYDEAFLEAFDGVVAPILGAYGPDVVVMELGMDALAGDPLTHLSLTNNALAAVVERIQGLDRPVLVAGGGGYHLAHTVRGWSLAWRVFAGEGEADDFGCGLGGVMLASSEWAGGLRDPVRVVMEEDRRSVEPELRAVMDRIRRTVFSRHGLGAESALPGSPPGEAGP